jgi:hypothetical protein
MKGIGARVASHQTAARQLHRVCYGAPFQLSIILIAGGSIASVETFIRNR